MSVQYDDSGNVTVTPEWHKPKSVKQSVRWVGCLAMMVTATVVLGSFLGLVAFAKVRQLGGEVESLKARVESLERSNAELTRADGLVNRNKLMSRVNWDRIGALERMLNGGQLPNVAAMLNDDLEAVYAKYGMAK